MVQERKLAAAYSAGLWRRRRVATRDEAVKLQLKWAAVAALPTQAMRQYALMVEPFIPLDYRLPTETPPRLGYAGSAMEARAAAADAAAAAAAAAANLAAAAKSKLKTAAPSLRPTMKPVAKKGLR